MILSRENAILFLAKMDMEKLVPSKRESIIIDMMDGEISNIGNIHDPKYNKLLLEWIVERYKGVRNKFLESEINTVL